jgi:hypothetical protein
MVMDRIKRRIEEERRRHREAEERLLAHGVPRSATRKLAGYVARGEITVEDAVRLARRLRARRVREIEEKLARGGGLGFLGRLGEASDALYESLLGGGGSKRKRRRGSPLDGLL